MSSLSIMSSSAASTITTDIFLDRPNIAPILEAQTISGGLAALLGLVIATRGLACQLWPLAIRASPDGRSGSQMDCWRRQGLDRSAIVKCALSIFGVSAR